MSSTVNQINDLTQQEYKWGFITSIDEDRLPPGLNEDVVRAISLKKGEPVILRLTSADRVHGFMSKPLKIDTDIAAGQDSTDVTVTPSSAGNFTVICDHYCGTGHGGMKMKVSVVQ